MMLQPVLFPSVVHDISFALFLFGFLGIIKFLKMLHQNFIHSNARTYLLVFNKEGGVIFLF
jgi:hypothetical protein